jgi:hypothetical protein
MTELSFHGINTSSFESEAKSVTHVSGTKRHLCLGSLNPQKQQLSPATPGLLLLNLSLPKTQNQAGI